jgi:predicted Zn-dependent peptidase
MHLNTIFIGFLFFISSVLFAQPKLVEQFQDNERISVIPPDMWAHEQAGISYEGSGLNFGHLENGMRYGVGKTASGVGCKISLMISVGSKEERPEESGMAHFLEHMVFRNSENFPDGRLNQLLTESLYGTANKIISAATSAFFTRYDVTLGNCSEAELRESVKILADIAFRAQFRPEDVNKEARIIEGEESKWLHQISREPNSIKELLSNRKIIDMSAHLWPSFGFIHPIGLSEIRASITAESINSFYRRWYIPAHMAIAYAGPTDGDVVQEMFALEFADFKRQATPDFSRPFPTETSPSTFLLPAVVPNEMQIYFADVSTPLSHNQFDEESLRTDLIYLVVADILQTSLNTAASGPAWLFNSTIKLAKSANGSRFFNLQISAYKDHETAVLRSFAALNRFAQTGFADSISHSKQRLVRYFESRKVPDSANDLMDAIFKDFRHAELIWPQPPSWLDDALEAITPEACQEAFQKGFLAPREREGFYAFGAAKRDLEAQARFAALLLKAKNIEAYEPEDALVPPPVFAYDDVPGTEFDKIKFEMASGNGPFQMALKNGPTIWSAPRSKSKDNRIAVMMIFGDLDFTNYSPLWALPYLRAPKGHSPEEIKALFPNIYVNFIPMGQGFMVYGTAPEGKLSGLLKYMRAILVDPDFSYLKQEDTLSLGRDAISSFHLRDEALLAQLIWRISDLAPAMDLDMDQILDQLTNTSTEVWEANMQAKVAQGISRIGFAGVVDANQAAGSFAQIFRNFPWRAAPTTLPKLTLQSGQHLVKIMLDSDCPAARVLVLLPLREKITPQQRSNFEAIAHFLEKAIFREIRVDMGEGYAPKVLAINTQGLADDFVLVDLWTSLENAVKVANKIEDVAISVAQHLTDDDRKEALNKATGRCKGGNSSFLSFLTNTPHKCRTDKSFNNDTLSNLEELKRLLGEIFVVGKSSSMVFLPR